MINGPGPTTRIIRRAAAKSKSGAKDLGPRTGCAVTGQLGILFLEFPVVVCTVAYKIAGRVRIAYDVKGPEAQLVRTVERPTGLHEE